MNSKYRFNPFTGKLSLIEGANSVGGSLFEGRVNVFADLPDPTTVSGQIYAVESNSGVIFINRQKAGLYISNGTTWDYLSSFTASQVPYDNSTSALIATDVKSAIDELENEIDGAASAVHTHIEADITDLDKYTQAEVDSIETGLQSQIDTNDTELAGIATDQATQNTAISNNATGVSTNAGDIAQEVTDRTSADTALQTNIDTEEAARIAADSAIQTQVTSNNADIASIQTDQTAQDTAIALNTAKVSADGSIDTHSDVDTSTVAPVIGQNLTWDGANWVPTSPVAKEYFQAGIAANQGPILNAATIVNIVETKNSNASIFSVAAGVVTITRAGTLKVSIAVTGETSTGAREELNVSLLRDGVAIPVSEGPSRLATYHRNNAADESTGALVTVIDVTAGQTLELSAISPTSGVNIIADGTSILVEEL